jgi:hypothetical protein
MQKDLQTITKAQELNNQIFINYGSEYKNTSGV